MNTHHEYTPSPNPTSFDAFASEYTKVRDGLPEQVRKPLDTFREEVMEICRAHGVDHPSKLVTPKAHASAETLKHVSDLLDDILSIFETKEVPLGHKDWEVEIPEGQYARTAIEKDGKAFFSTRSTESFFIFDSSGAFKEYPGLSLEEFIIVNQQPIYHFEGNDDSLHHIFVNGKEVTPESGCQDMNFLSEMNGTFVYVAMTNDKLKDNIFLDGKVYGDPEGYHYITHMIPVGNQIAFSAQKKEGEPFHVYLGDQIVGDPAGYKEIKEMIEVDGTLAFIGENDFGCWLISRDGAEQKYWRDGKFYGLQEMGGALSWKEMTVGEEESTLCIAGETYGKYRVIEKVFYTGGDPLVLGIKKKESCRTLTQGERTIGKQEGYEVFEDIGDVICVGDEVIFVTKEGGYPWIIESSSGTHFGSYDHVLFMRVVGNKHFMIIAEEDGKVVQRTFDLDHPPYQGKLPN